MPMEKQDIIDAIRNVLDDDEWNYDLETDREDGPIIRTGCRIGGKLRNISEVIDFGDTFFLVFALCPIHADPENLVELSKYLHMANYGLVLGNFELDHRDGEIRYKAMVDCNGLDAIPSAIIDRAIHRHLFRLRLTTIRSFFTPHLLFRHIILRRIHLFNGRMYASVIAGTQFHSSCKRAISCQPP